MNGFQKSIVLSALDQEDKLTDWKVDFISYIADMSDDYDLSEKQNSIINRISQKLD